MHLLGNVLLMLLTALTVYLLVRTLADGITNHKHD